MHACGRLRPRLILTQAVSFFVAPRLKEPTACRRAGSSSWVRRKREARLTTHLQNPLASPKRAYDALRSSRRSFRPDGLSGPTEPYSCCKQRTLMPNYGGNTCGQDFLKQACPRSIFAVGLATR